MKKVQIGSLQAATIFANLVFGKAIGYTSEALARAVGHDAWISMSIAFFAGMIVIALMVWLVRRCGGRPAAEFIPRLLGRPLGAVALLLLALFFFGAFLTSAITITQHVNDYLMTETPLLVFVVIYTLVCMYGAYLGLEVTARLSVLGLALTLLLDVLVVIGSIDHMDVERLLPIMDHGAIAVTSASFIAAQDVAYATAAALVLLPLTRAAPGKWLKISWWGLGIGALSTLVWPIFEIGVLGADMISQYLIACMQLARAAELSLFLHRYEMLMVVLFVYGVFTQSIVCLYSAVELTAAALPLRRLKRSWLVAVMGLVGMVVHYFMAFDRQWYGRFLSDGWPYVAVPLGWGLPLLLCAVALVRPGLGRAGKAARVGEPSSR